MESFRATLDTSVKDSKIHLEFGGEFLSLVVVSFAVKFQRRYAGRTLIMSGRAKKLTFNKGWAWLE